MTSLVAGHAGLMRMDGSRAGAGRTCGDWKPNEALGKLFWGFLTGTQGRERRRKEKEKETKEGRKKENKRRKGGGRGENKEE